MAGLNKEIWLSLLIGANENFWQSDWFLKKGEDMSQYVVANSFLNFAHKGDVPGVIKNPTYPLATVSRTDVADKIPMNNYATQRTQLPRVDLMKLAYDKKDSVLRDHREALVNQIATEGLWVVSPYQNTTNTPVVATDAGNAAASDGFKVITGKDIMNLRVALDKAYPQLKNAPWTLAMDAVAFWALIDSDTNLKGQIQNQGAMGVVGVQKVIYYGFEVVCDSRTPYYTSGNVRVAFGATVNTGAGDRPSATAFIEKRSFCTAMGQAEMFLDEKDSQYQADFASFLLPASVTPWSQDLQTNLKFLGAIIRK